MKSCTFSRTFVTATLALSSAFALPGATAQETKLILGMSGWTGFAPLTLADKAGLFKKNGLNVDIRMIPQKDRHLALASGAIQCVATTVETYVAWNANGVPVTQIFQMDKSYGADGMAVRNDVNSFADLKGKTIAVSAPGTTPYFNVAWMLSKNGLSMKDVKLVTLEPQPAAQSFVLGRNDAAFTYEPYLSMVREKPEAGKILATTIEYPMVMDTVGCDPKWLAANPKAAKMLAESYFDAVEMIKTKQNESYTIMGAAVKQTAEQFGKSASYIRWADRAENKKFFAEDILPFMREAAVIQKEAGVIRAIPDNMESMVDAQFIQ